ncbi:MAG TPA: MurT ligase domain-containing protein [Mycobacteriales bacterium]|nr:MurT ligase domain-containing protein [Mycobacteriales bacterium]
MRLRTRTALGVGRLAAATSRRLGRGAGEVVGGTVALRFAPDALAELATGRTVATVSGTNGKTTTTRLLSAALATQGPVVSNAGGANMPAGVITALASATHAERAALEVDELHLPGVARATQPKVACLLNLSRDQLDRANETRRIAGIWRSLGGELPGTRAVANADDPLVVWAADGFGATTWVGAGQVWTADAMVCPRCAQLLRRDAHRWWCPACGLERPETTIDVGGPTQLVVDGARHDIALHLPGRCNVANAAIAAAAARELGVDISTALHAMEQVEAVAGRYETVRLGGRDARLLLAKNPAGWVEMIELLEAAPARPMVIGFNARAADGRDPSWIWDVPVQRLGDRPVLVYGDRAADLRTRLAYAGIDAPSFGSAADALRAAPGDAPVDLLATYTAFRDLLVETGLA